MRTMRWIACLGVGLFCVLLNPSAQAGSLRDAWSFYLAAVNKGASPTEREDYLKRLLSNPDYAKEDLSLIKKELQRVQTDVSFADSMAYFERQARSGLSRAAQAEMLKSIIEKYDKRGMDMSAQRARLAELLLPEESPARAKRAAPAAAIEEVEKQLKAENRWDEEVDTETPAPYLSHQGVSLLVGWHVFPSGGFLGRSFRNASSSDFSGPAAGLEFEQRFERFGWGVWAAHYRESASYTVLSGPGALPGKTTLGALPLQAAAHAYLTPPDSSWGARVGFGAGPVFWSKNTSEPDPDGVLPARSRSASGVATGFHLSGRLSLSLGESWSVFVQDAFVFSQVDSSDLDLFVSGDEVDFGGHVLALGVSRTW